MNRIADIEYSVKRSEVYAIRKADNSPPGKALFGGGFIISERAAAERAAAERAAAERAAAHVVELSPREIEIQKGLV